MLVILTVGMQYDSQFLIIFITLSLIGMITVPKIRYTRRFDLIRVGFHLGVAGVLIMMSLYFIDKCLIDVSNTLIFKKLRYYLLQMVLSVQL